MKTKILLIFCLLIAGSQIKGQIPDSISFHNRSNLFSIQFGLNQIREMNLIPLVHKGMNTEFSFGSEKINRSLRQVQFSLVYSRLKTDLEEISESANIKLGFSYSYNFPLIAKNKLHYYLGPQASLWYSIMMFPNWDESHGYWNNFLSFGANNILAVYLRDEREWITSLNFSIFGFLSRPDEIRPYKMDDFSTGGILKSLHSNIEAGIINRIVLINFKTEYRFPVFKSKREAITFNMEISRLSRKNEQPAFQIINQIGIKIML